MVTVVSGGGVMQRVKSAATTARELVPALAVAVAVVLVWTLGAAWVASFNQADAEDKRSHEIEAAAGPNGQQTLAVKDWGVQLTAPLIKEMTLLRYASQSDVTVGLSTAELVEFGDKCKAGKNGLGALIRLGAGSYIEYSKTDPRANYIKTIGDYDYVYQSPQNACADYPGARNVIIREKSVLYEALQSLSLIAQ
jgi:hypothetical protein